MCMPAAQAWIDQLAGQGKAVRYRQGRAGRGRAGRGRAGQGRAGRIRGQAPREAKSKQEW